MSARLRGIFVTGSWPSGYAVASVWLLLALSITLAGCGSLSAPEQDGLVKIYERLPPLPPFGTDQEILEFRGKKYGHLFSQNYVSVPELDGIIFATRREGGNVKLHYVPKHGKGEITVDEGEYYDFGTRLGRPRDGVDTEYVESVADDKVTFFSTPGPFMKATGHTNGHHYVLDLRARKFSRVGPQDRW